MSDVVNKLWGFCHTLRHDGVDYGDYIEQITYLLFLKMADEKALDLSALKWTRESGGAVVDQVTNASWPWISARSGTSLTDAYEEALAALGKQKGILGDIYAGSQSRFPKPVSLKKILNLIDEVRWTSLEVDVKAAAYEGLLEKAASEGKKGAGQFFTPRPLIRSIVRCMKPDPRASEDFTICDPACGSAGFLVAAYEWLVSPEVTNGALVTSVAKRVRSRTYFGEELVPRPRRLALMNMYLHGVTPTIPIRDAIDDPATADRFDVVLTNPPFGTKGGSAAPTRDEFTVETKNKQLNFIQHVMHILKPGGRAAMVLPDNCLFADAAGDVLEILTADCDLHTVLRLPRGTFTPYAQGVRANVFFFTKGTPTERIWIYDARSGVPGITKKDRPLTEAHFAGFEAVYGADPDGRSPRDAGDSADDRWRSFTIAEAMEAAFKLDRFKWLKDDVDEDDGDLPEPEEITALLMERLRTAMDEVTGLQAALGGGE